MPFLGPNDHFLRSERRWTQKIVPPSTGYGPKLLIHEIKVTVNGAKSMFNAQKTVLFPFLGPNDHFLRSERWWTQKIVPPSTGYGPKLLIHEIKVTVNGAKSTVNAPKTVFLPFFRPK